MDFLDPRSKKRRTIRLMIGYALVGIMIVTTSTILVFQAYGFDVDRKTGEVIQNGLVFIDSAPDDAAIFLNGVQQKSRSNARLAIPGGTYDLRITKDGYRDWTRSFELSGGDVERFTYPLLLQQNLAEEPVVTLDQQKPQITTQSPDRRWVLIAKGPSLTEYFEFDLNNLGDETNIPRQRSISFPAEIFSNGTSRSLELVEWSTDNKHLLIKHTYDTSTEFIMLNRDQPATSFNINRLLERAPTSVVLRDKKFDEWYIHTAEGGVLESADARKNIEPIDRDVVAFKPHDSETLLYVKASTNATSQQVIVRQDDEVYNLREVGIGTVQLDVARYDRQWYMLVASDADKKTYIYKEPLATLEQTGDRRPAPRMVLGTTTGTFNWIGFSQNTRFIVAQSGQHFEVYDLEYEDMFRFDISDNFDAGTEVKWMDGHRMIARSGGEMVIFDFDGSNKQKLIPALNDASVFFDRDYTELFTVNSIDEQTPAHSLVHTSLRFEQDK